jgi:hypothetical protein
MKLNLLILMLATALSLPVAANEYTDLGLTQVKRINDYKIDSWQHVDDYSLVIRGGVSNYYLVTFKNRCRELKYAHAIAAPTKGGALQAGFDSIRVVNRDSIPMPCMIKEIYELKGDRAAAKAMRESVKAIHEKKYARK